MRIATLRFHYVVPPKLLNPTHLDHNGTGPKDLWGFVSTPSTARACLLALTVSEEEFPKGHETFFIAAPTTCRKRETMELVKESYPEIKDFRRLLKGNDGLLDCSKAKRMLGWTEEGFVWDP